MRREVQIARFWLNSCRVSQSLGSCTAIRSEALVTRMIDSTVGAIFLQRPLHKYVYVLASQIGATSVQLPILATQQNKCRPIEPHPTPKPCIHLHRHPSHRSCGESETLLFIVVFICFFVLSLDDRRNSILCRCFRRRDVYRRRHGKSMCHPSRWLSSSGTFMPFDCSAAFWNQTVSTSLLGLPPLLRGALTTTLTPKSIFFLVFCFVLFCFFFLGGGGGIHS